jgi:cytochrome c1
MRFFTFGLLLAITAAPNVWGQVTYLNQGWDADQRDEFYFTAQGSQLIPFEWFLELEQATEETPFRDDDNMLKYGLLPTKPSVRNPYGLPVGFVRDGVDHAANELSGLKASERSAVESAVRFGVKKAYLGESFDQKLYPTEQSWFGLTCAACHTHDIKFGDKVIRIDGGSAQSDIESFLRDLEIALDATAKNNKKLERFAIRVGRDSKDLSRFQKEVQQIADAVNRLVARNRAKQPYGYARLDAFGAILNAVCETALSEPANNQESNAPVSYPSLWNTPQMAYVQWNASAASAEGRNVGEVLGVFGTYTIEPGDKQFDSTVRLGNLVRLEHELAAKLHAPDWPEDIFGKLDLDKVQRGEALFAKNCVSCHSIRDDDGQFALNEFKRIPIRSNTIDEVKTDSQFLKNLALTNTASTGSLKAMLGGADRVPRVVMLGFAVAGITKNRVIAEGVQLPPQLSRDDQASPHPAGPGSGYISRPLEGIWANAPYFHNGSVPNLYETLLPANKRSKSFWVGNLEFDPVKVGFLTEESTVGSMFNVVDDQGSTIIGNSNAGHEGFGANENEGFTQTFEDGAWRDFTDDERYALVEYMKSLSSKPAAKTVQVEQIPDGEAAQITNIVDLTVQQMLARYPKDERTLRGVHPKDHGCVTAKFEVLPTLAAKHTVGVLKPGAKYNAFIRFSNAEVRVGPDSTRDEAGKPVHGSRGMAIKLLGVEGESLLPLHGALTQDFVMVNQPAFAFANVEDYKLLSQVLLDNNDQAAKFFAERLSPSSTSTPEQKERAQRTRQIVGRIRADSVSEGAFFEPPASPVDNPYFSASPFLFGEGKVMKFRVSPVARSMDKPNVDDPNYLRTALIERLKTEAVVFDFAIQVRDADKLNLATDIENASTEWNDEYVSVARITIPRQNFDSPEHRVKCEKLFFTPWHGIAEHLPLGGVNRLRKAVYLESGKHRNLPKEPASIDE